MARKVILDVDPGISDALAIALALADPRLEVIAVTATGGCVPPDQATRNVQAIIEQLDPQRWPRIGAAATDTYLPADLRHLNGSDGLGENLFNVAELVHQHPSDKVICDEVRAAPGEVAIIALGPLTNVAAALQRDPDLANAIGDLIIMGGTYSGPGNVTAAAEFNVFCNPLAARTVFRSPATKTLIPLDATSQVVMTYDQFDQLPSDGTRTGSFLRKLLPFAFRAYRQHAAMEGIFIHDAVALVMAVHPELFEVELGIGDVEIAGELTAGATVFDRRRMPLGQSNMEVATGIDAAAVMDCILRGLRGAD